jgi:hypothetical protein
MGGCCLAVLILLLGPRLFLIAVWLLTNWYVAFDSRLVAFLAGFSCRTRQWHGCSSTSTTEGKSKADTWSC